MFDMVIMTFYLYTKRDSSEKTCFGILLYH